MDVIVVVTTDPWPLVVVTTVTIAELIGLELLVCEDVEVAPLPVVIVVGGLDGV